MKCALVARINRSGARAIVQHRRAGGVGDATVLVSDLIATAHPLKLIAALLRQLGAGSCGAVEAARRSFVELAELLGAAGVVKLPAASNKRRAFTHLPLASFVLAPRAPAHVPA